MKRAVAILSLLIVCFALLCPTVMAAMPTSNARLLNGSSRAANDHYLHINGTTYIVPNGTVVGYNYTTYGTYVGTAQRALNFIDGKNMSNSSGTLSCNCGAIDEVFGSATYSAAYNFQYWCNFNSGWTQQTVDGIIGNRTWTSMNWYCG